MRREHKGENHHCAKLSEEQALEILRAHPWPRHYAKLKANEFGVSKHTIYSICYRKSWTHLDAQ